MLLLAFVAGSGGQSQASPGALQALSVGAGPTPLSWLAWIAVGGDFFKTEGFDAQIVKITAGTQIAPGLSGNTFQVAVGLDVTLAAALHRAGIDVTMVSGAGINPFKIVGAGKAPSSAATSFPDGIKALAGKSVLIVGPGTLTGNTVLVLNKLLGLSSNPIKTLPVGTVGGLVSAFESGRAPYLVADPSQLAALQAAHFDYYTVLDLQHPLTGAAASSRTGQLANTIFGRPVLGTWALSSYASSNGAQLHRVVRALERADCWSHSSKNLSALIAILKESKLIPAGLTDAQTEAFVKGALPISYFAKADFDAWNTFLVEIGFVPQPLPASVLAASVPATPGAVRKDVVAAGGSCDAYANLK